MSNKPLPTLSQNYLLYKMICIKVFFFFLSNRLSLNVNFLHLNLYFPLN